jgi:hypothetical protein
MYNGVTQLSFGLLHVLLIVIIRPYLFIVRDGEEGFRLHHLWDGVVSIMDHARSSAVKESRSGDSFAFSHIVPGEILCQ